VNTQFDSVIQQTMQAEKDALAAISNSVKQSKSHGVRIPTPPGTNLAAFVIVGGPPCGSVQEPIS